MVEQKIGGKNSFMIRIVEADNKTLINEFIDIPYKLYPKESFWVPPLKSEEKKLLSSKNPFWKENSYKLFIARKDGKDAGRVAAIINREHNRYHNDKIGFFGFFESVNDNSVTEALIGAASKFLKENGLNSIRGPVNPSMNDTCGVLIEGFYQMPVFMMPYNFPYYDKLLTSVGFSKAMDLYAWYLTLIHPTERLERLEQKIIKREKLSIRKFSKKQFMRDIEYIWELYCNAWKDNWGFTPPTKEQFFFGTKDLKNMVEEDYVLFIENDGKPVAFSVFMPDFNQVLKQYNGVLHFWQIPFLLRSIKKIRSVRMPVLGIKEGWRGRGLDLILYIESFKIAKRYGFAGGEMSWTLETNSRINGGIKKMGSELYKRYRIYEKAL